MQEVGEGYNQADDPKKPKIYATSENVIVMFSPSHSLTFPWGVIGKRIRKIKSRKHMG